MAANYTKLYTNFLEYVEMKYPDFDCKELLLMPQDRGIINQDEQDHIEANASSNFVKEIAFK